MDYQTGLWKKYLVTGDWSQSKAFLLCVYTSSIQWLCKRPAKAQTPNQTALSACSSKSQRHVVLGTPPPFPHPPPPLPALPKTNESIKSWKDIARWDNKEAPPDLPLWFCFPLFFLYVISAIKKEKLRWLLRSNCASAQSTQDIELLVCANTQTDLGLRGSLVPNYFLFH